MRIRTAAVAAFALACALTACSSSTDQPSSESETTASEVSQEDKDAAAAAAGIPPEPIGADRQDLLDTLADAAPDVVRYEDEAIDAARNQCSAINGGAGMLDYLAAQRFTYKDVTTTEEQAARINDALKASGFCKL
ncbi:hypothetical protein STRCI_007812 [Streptomyces cinnabarinus]|uniref:DUF732 domain-containing protein n=1 Tax=Streptomyces cinnabarinus TaxID=67287 RepID=A0ABY7KTH5_9ACTN|nr:hypothetical protein [Streptomyces cinnabarinus]WAZ26256.1 hypothetical protein STRCI_007812 [Streptomyces cinnabarinus]